MRIFLTHELHVGKFMLHNSNVQISRSRFRSIARDQISMWSRRWTVNLVTAGEARRAVAFINLLFLILRFEILKISKISKKIIISRNCILKCSKNIPKFEKNENWEKFSQHSYDLLNFCQVQFISESQEESCICH